MKKNKVAVLLIFIINVLAGCASRPAFEGKGDLCGLVVDENNKPVKDFVVHCKSTKLLSKNYAALTNESGLFVFFNLPSGEYILNGEKKNYLRVENITYSFNDRSKILCLQTKSFKGCVLSTEELLRLGQAQEAGELLKNVCCETGSSEEHVLQEFIAKLEEVTK